MVTWPAFRRALLFPPLSAWIGIIVVAAYILVAVLGPFLSPHGETEIVGAAYQPWGGPFVLGTDNLGRDMLTRLIYGARNTTGLAVVIAAIAFVIGCFPALLAATLGGWIDQVLGRFVDVVMSIPALIFAMLFLSFFGNTIPVLIVVIAILEATRVFRVARSVAKTIVVLDYVEAARLRGEGLLWITCREILPNALPPLIAEFGLRFCFVVLLISSLSFLGLGIQPPRADLGSMVRDNATLISFGSVLPLLPAAAIGLLVVAMNMIVDWISDLASRSKR